jgi:hypothetical protein
VRIGLDSNPDRSKQKPISVEFVEAKSFSGLPGTVNPLLNRLNVAGFAWVLGHDLKQHVREKYYQPPLVQTAELCAQIA